MTTAGPRFARMALALVTTAAALVVGMFAAPSSQAARGMELAIQDEGVFVVGNKRWQGDKPFDYARAIGVTRIRANVSWAYTMYPQQYRMRNRPNVVQYDFSNLDALVDRAAKNGIRVHLSLTGPAPRWANSRKKQPQSGAWYKPNAAEYGKWAGVVAEHFAGRVDRYSIWNEPNWKTWLGPLSVGPSLYRSLYSRGYNAIKKADSRAKVLIGETSPYARPGLSTAPLAFLRAVTCVNKKYKRARNCTKLKADGYAHHPYDFTHAPGFQYPGEDNVTIGTLSRLTRALDKLSRAGVLPAAGLHDRAQERARQEPAPVPAADVAQQLAVDVQHRDRDPVRQAPVAVQRAPALVQGQPRQGQAPGRRDQPAGGARKPDRLSRAPG